MDEQTFELRGDKIVMQVINTTERFAWRLVVNGDEGEWCSYYAGVYEHKGYYLAMAYWEGVFPIERPFRIELAERSLSSRLRLEA